jgi:wyosine [tRNA(Phe)-imidazoG37] synthetase (radical SAM superfamily)
MFFTVEEIMGKFDEVLRNNIDFGVVTIVGEGETTLYLGLGELISEMNRLKINRPHGTIDFK